MPDVRDGTYRCESCKCPLNKTDYNCWRCGSTRIAEIGRLSSKPNLAVQPVPPELAASAKSFADLITREFMTDILSDSPIKQAAKPARIPQSRDREYIIPPAQTPEVRALALQLADALVHAGYGNFNPNTHEMQFQRWDLRGPTSDYQELSLGLIVRRKR